MPRLVSLRLVPHAVVIALLMAGCIAGEKLEAANDGDGDGDVNINNNYDFGAPNPDDVVADSPPAPDSASDATAPPDLVDDVAPDTGRPAMDIDWSGTFVGVIDLVIPGISSSALDVDTEKELWARVFALKESDETTCLVVSHRKTALQKADHVIVMADGRKHDEGTLESLLDRCVEMQKLWKGLTQ